MSAPYIGEIRVLSFNFAPFGWALCDGQLLPIAQHPELFSILGTAYGGDGKVTFALPDLRGRVPVHAGGSALLGERGGEEAHFLTVSEMPTHTHGVRASAAVANQGGPNNAYWASSVGDEHFSGATPDVAMHPGSVTVTGGGQPHSNMQPYQTLTFAIAVQGSYPTGN